MKQKNKCLKKILKIVFLYIPISFFALTLFWVLMLKWVPTFYTPLMALRSIQNIGNEKYKIHKTWKSIDEISENMPLAVMASEDNLFLYHHGFDWKEIKNSIDENKKGRRIRGASTISQQTAKNVFLFPTRSWVRKGFEVYFTIAIELIWGKERIMEVYLNVIEIGNGVFGVEAASSLFFSKPASRLTRYESALIASALPSPLKRKVNRPSYYMEKRAYEIMELMSMIGVSEWRNTVGTNNNSIKKRYDKSK